MGGGQQATVDTRQPPPGRVKLLVRQIASIVDLNNSHLVQKGNIAPANASHSQTIWQAHTGAMARPARCGSGGASSRSCRWRCAARHLQRLALSQGAGPSPHRAAMSELRPAVNKAAAAVTPINAAMYPQNTQMTDPHASRPMASHRPAPSGSACAALQGPCSAGNHSQASMMPPAQCANCVCHPYHNFSRH